MNTADIINYNSELYLSQDYILENTGIDYGYLRVAKSRFNKGKSESWMHIELNNKSYFDYSKLPVGTKNSLPTKQNLLNIAVSHNDNVVVIVKIAKDETINAFLKVFGKNQDLALPAAIIYEANKYITNNKISFSKSAFFKKLANEIDIQQIKYLPKTWRNLRNKIKEYASGTPITDILGAKNKGNQNRTKHAKNEVLESWLIGLIESQKNYSAAYIFRQIRRMSVQHGMVDFPSVRWISDYLNKPETQYITQQRYGANSRFNHKYRPYVPTQSALFAGDCWQIDGTRVNIIDHKATYINKAGKKVTGNKFLYIIAVRDVMSGMVLGWEYCYEESASVVINALAMAVRTAGYLPYEFVYDRFPGHNTDDWHYIETYMRIAGTIMTVTHKAEGKPHIERWWDTLQNVFMMDSDLYYGEGIKSTRRYAHRSKEYVASMRKWASDNKFNYDDACKETDDIVNRYLNTPLSVYSTKYAKIDQSPAQLHEVSDKPNTYAITDYNWCFLFGLNKQVSISNYMIHTQIDNVQHYYGIDDCDVIAKYTGVKLTNCFDYEDLSTVHLFDGNDYVGSFSEITPAQQFGPNKDMRAVGKLKSIAEKVNTDRKAKRAKIKEVELVEVDEDYSEVSMMQGGMIPKHNYESAETAYLLGDWQADDEEIVLTAKNQY